MYERLVKLRREVAELSRALAAVRACLHGIASCASCEVCRGATKTALSKHYSVNNVFPTDGIRKISITVPFQYLPQP